MKDAQVDNEYYLYSDLCEYPVLRRQLWEWKLEVTLAGGVNSSFLAMCMALTEITDRQGDHRSVDTLVTHYKGFPTDPLFLLSISAPAVSSHS